MYTARNFSACFTIVRLFCFGTYYYQFMQDFLLRFSIDMYLLHSYFSLIVEIVLSNELT